MRGLRPWLLPAAASAFSQSSPWGLKMARMISSPPWRTNAVTAADVLKTPKWPEGWPYSPEDFKRTDEQSDGIFYESSRLVYHIDEPAVAALTEHYATVFSAFEKPPDVLDICSSW